MEPMSSDEKELARHMHKAFELIEKEKIVTKLHLNGIERESKVIQHQFLKKSTGWWMAAAMIAVIIAIVAYVQVNLSKPDVQQLADNELSSLTKDYNFSYRSVESEQHLKEVQTAINDNQWEKAAEQLDLAFETTSSSDTTALITIQFYKGIVDLQQNNFNNAILNFTSVANYKSSALQNDAVWLRGLAHIKNKNIEAAKADLQLTSQLKGWKKAEEAKEILRLIDDK